jgi:hypothetical protein
MRKKAQKTARQKRDSGSKPFPTGDLKGWSFSTSMRNPDRIGQTLEVVNDLLQKDPSAIWGDRAQAVFFDILKKKFYTQGSQSKKGLDNAARARTAISPAAQLGLVIAENGAPLFLTPTGVAMLDYLGKGSQEGVRKTLLTALSRFQLTWRGTGKKIPGDGSPLGSILALYDALSGIRPHSPSLTKGEAKLLLPLLTGKSAAARIVQLLKQRDNGEQGFERAVAAISCTKLETLADYGDTLSRYLTQCGLTEWVAGKNGQAELRVVSCRLNQAKRICLHLERDDTLSANKDEYLQQLRGPVEAWPFWLGDKEDHQVDCQLLAKEIEGITRHDVGWDSNDPEAFFVLLEKRRQAGHTFFAISEKPSENLGKVMADLEDLRTLKKSTIRGFSGPLALEVFAGRAIAAFGGITNHNPRYITDYGNHPISTATGGEMGADCIVESFNSVLVIESTMMRSGSQNTHEFEPILRHVSAICKKSQKENKDACLMLAPTIHVDLMTRCLSQARDVGHGSVSRTANLVPLDIIEFNRLLAPVHNAWKFDGFRVPLDEAEKWVKETFVEMRRPLLDQSLVAWRGFISDRLKEWEIKVAKLVHSHKSIRLRKNISP